MTINRKENTVAIDRLDANWWIAEPFLGQRDLFYVDEADKQAVMNGGQHRLTFVRHNFWLHKMFKFNKVFGSNFAARSYKSAFSRHQVWLSIV